MSQGSASEPIYTGDRQYQPSPGHRDRLGRLLKPYLPSDDLIEVVNLAIELERPLLLQGEPGCGKTLLARAIAYEFGQHYLGKDEWPYYAWNIKSTSRAADGLYRYDAIARLRDAQLVGIDPSNLEGYLNPSEIGQLINRLKINRLKKRDEYCDFGPLGKAFQEENYRPLLLIDEIDKADIDFPNDLLLELDEKRFNIPEIGCDVPPAKYPPITIITSNSERPLSDAFLRRCLYFYVEFPDEDRLKEIVELHYPLAADREKLVRDAVDRFLDLRDVVADRPDGKPAGTSEFLDFMGVLLRKPLDTAREYLTSLPERLPLLGTLLKTKSDRDRYLDDAADE